MYGRGSRGPTAHVCSICSVVRTRDRVAGAGYACSARLAALFLATGAAHAQSEPCTDEDARKSVEAIKALKVPKWRMGRWTCDLVWNQEWDQDEKPPTIMLEDIPEILKMAKSMKKCRAWMQCLDDREAGKVKHCYATSSTVTVPGDRDVELGGFAGELRIHVTTGDGDEKATHNRCRCAAGSSEYNNLTDDQSRWGQSCD
jgi:hypothetical protein